MSVIGPRPQLVRDMVFMTDEQRMRHTAKPGLSGLAQVNGRNAISWEDKIDWDLWKLIWMEIWKFSGRNGRRSLLQRRKKSAVQ